MTLTNWHTRYRRLIDLYRSALIQKHPIMAKHCDTIAEDWGEHWVTREELPPLDALWSASEIAKWFGFQRWDIANWVRAGKIQRHDTPEGPKYLIRDVLKYFSQKNST